jgi:hypothetical protein
MGATRGELPRQGRARLGALEWLEWAVATDLANELDELVPTGWNPDDVLEDYTHWLQELVAGAARFGHGWWATTRERAA